MKQVLIEAYGTPWEVARCADVPDVGEPAADEVVFDVLAFPINPADMGFCRGSYRLKPPLPATPGAECVGRVTAVGASVRHVKPGDLVILLDAGAYGMSLSSNYNTRPRPAEVLVDGTETRLIRRRETWKDLFAPEIS